MSTPSGEEVQGFKVTIDDGLPDAKTDYIRERVIEILKPHDYKVTVKSNTNIVVIT